MATGGVIVVAFIDRYATVRTHDPDWVVKNAEKVYYVRQKVRNGLDAVRNGKVIPQEEIEKRMERWIAA